MQNRLLPRPRGVAGSLRRTDGNLHYLPFCKKDLVFLAIFVIVRVIINRRSVSLSGLHDAYRPNNYNLRGYRRILKPNIKQALFGVTRPTQAD